MKRPVCIHCSQTYRTKKVGVSALEIDDDNEPVGVWHADVLGCSGCGHEILWGFGNDAIWRPWHPDFQNLALRADYRFRL